MNNTERKVLLDTALAALLAAACFPAAPAFCEPAPARPGEGQCADVTTSFFLPSREAGCFEPARPGALKEGNTFRMPKPAGRKRFFIIGDSTAGLLARPCRGGGRNCLSLLAASLGYDAEVVNAGMPAYDSDLTYGVLKEVTRYSPDAVVALAGSSENTGLCPGLRRRLAETFYRGLNLLSWHLAPGRLAKKHSLDRQDRIFTRMAALAGKKNIPLVFCSLPFNLSDFPPSGSLPMENRDFALGWAAYEKSGSAEAVKFFSAYLKAQPDSPMGLYYLGQAQLKTGAADAARASLTRAADLDPSEVRGAGSRNNMIRSVAEKTGSPVADLEGLFAAYAPGRIPGGGMFSDGVRWLPEYDMLVSCAVMEKIAQVPALAPASGAKVWETPLCRAAAISAGARRSARGSAMEKAALTRRLSGYLRLAAGMSSGSRIYEGPVALLQRLYRADPAGLLKLSSSQEAFADGVTDSTGTGKGARFQIGEFPGFWPYYLAHLAEALSRSGQPGPAVKYFKQALGGGMAPDEIYFHRAWAYFRTGDKKRAVADLARLPAGQADAANLAALFGAGKELAAAFEDAEKKGQDARPGDQEEPGSLGGDSGLYYVYGGKAPLTGGDGFHPEKFGYTLLGSAPTGATEEFRGEYPYYAIVVRYTGVLELDALQLSNGSYYSGWFSDGNVSGWENAAGAPDGRYARIGGNAGLREGYLLIGPGPGFKGVKVFARSAPRVK